jgi:hypothetical protein
MTTAPRGMTSATVSEALTSGERSGRLAPSIGVTVTMKTLQAARSDAVEGESETVRSFGAACFGGMRSFGASRLRMTSWDGGMTS